MNSPILTDTPSVITNENANLSSTERITPVESFDIAIYDDKGNELWNKDNQMVTAGRAFLRTVLDTDYSGGISIVINNIKSPTTSDDSVRFTAVIQGNQA